MTFGIIFIILGITFLVCFLCWICSDKDERFFSVTTGFIVTNIICWAVLAIIAMTSYNSYIDTKTYPETAYLQDYQALCEYDRIISDKGGKGELTDLKFQGYQESMARLVTRHADKVIAHNYNIAGKRIMAQNCLIGFLIFEPDPMTEVLPFVPK